MRGTITGNPEASIVSSTHSIPFEISTDVRLLYVFSLYGGLGTDINFGSAEGKGHLNADESVISCSDGPDCATATNPDMKVQADADINVEGKVNPILFRGFVGFQINLHDLRFYGQIDKALGNNLIGATAGIRFVF